MPDQTFTAYAVIDEPPTIQKASLTREWMSAANQNFPYRCLPLTMANQMGWDLINPMTFTAEWNGGDNHTDVVIETPTRQKHPLVVTHFGVATFTFSLGYVFRTPPGIALMFTGPSNYPLDGVTPCTGYVETEWLPATATMNWLCTRPGMKVVFPIGMPMCRIYPYPRGLLEQMSPEIRSVSENPELQTQFQEWSKRRDHFNKELHNPQSESSQRKWQRDYFLGGGQMAKEKIWPDCRDIHQTKFSHVEFEDKRSDSRYINDRYKVDYRPLPLRTGGTRRIIWVRHQLQDQTDDQTRIDTDRVVVGGYERDSEPENTGTASVDSPVDGVRDHHGGGVDDAVERTQGSSDQNSDGDVQETSSESSEQV